MLEVDISHPLEADVPINILIAELSKAVRYHVPFPLLFQAKVGVFTDVPVDIEGKKLHHGLLDAIQ